MKGKTTRYSVIVALLAAIVIFGQIQPPRKTYAEAQAEEWAQAKIEQAEKLEKEISVAEETVDTMKVKFECSNGTFVVECNREWAPLGFDQFKKLVEAKFFDGCRFFRVIPGFVVQFGLNGDPETNLEWGKMIKDDEVVESNEKGTLTFATSGPNSRTTQLFINLGNNARLDGMGFAPFGKVVEGMDVVDAICSEYGEAPNQGAIRSRGNAYLEDQFPNLDYIKSATIVE